MGRITILRLVKTKKKPRSRNQGVEKQELDVLLNTQSFPEEKPAAPCNKKQLYSITKKKSRKE